MASTNAAARVRFPAIVPLFPAAVSPVTNKRSREKRGLRISGRAKATLLEPSSAGRIGERGETGVEAEQLYLEHYLRPRLIPPVRKPSARGAGGFRSSIRLSVVVVQVDFGFYMGSIPHPRPSPTGRVSSKRACFAGRQPAAVAWCRRCKSWGGRSAGTAPEN